MNKNDINKITKTAEKLGWTVTVENKKHQTIHEFTTFSQYSPAGQDFSFTISNAENLESMYRAINSYYENYDCSEETYAWLDSSGHGANGAPYDMRDLYNDMEACREMIQELGDAIGKLLK